MVVVVVVVAVAFSFSLSFSLTAFDANLICASSFVDHGSQSPLCTETVPHDHLAQKTQLVTMTTVVDDAFVGNWITKVT